MALTRSAMVYEEKRKGDVKKAFTRLCDERRTGQARRSPVVADMQCWVVVCTTAQSVSIENLAATAAGPIVVSHALGAGQPGSEVPPPPPRP